MSWFPLWPHIMLFLLENSSVLGWPLHISSTIPVWTLSGCRGPSDKDACSGALLPSNGKRLPHTQRRSAPLRLPVRGQTGDQGTEQVGAKGERPPHWANWFNRWCRAGQACRWTAVNRCKEDASVMDAKGCQLPPPGCGFGQNSTLLQVLLHYFQLICTNKHTHTHTRSQIWFIEINVDSALRPRWSSHNGGAGRPLMGVSDWFQAWLALIESPQEAPGNHRPTPELFHQKQDGAEICRMPSSFSRIPIEVQYILGTYYLWNWIDFCHQLHPSMAKQLRVMDHFMCHSMLP